jgi:hypothetical protein
MGRHEEPPDPNRGDGHDPNRPVPPPPDPNKHEKK